MLEEDAVAAANARYRALERGLGLRGARHASGALPLCVPNVAPAARGDLLRELRREAEASYVGPVPRVPSRSPPPPPTRLRREASSSLVSLPGSPLPGDTFRLLTGDCTGPSHWV